MTVQLAVADEEYSFALRNLLLNDGLHQVVASKLDASENGVVVVDFGSLGDVLFVVPPERIVVVLDKRQDELKSIWQAGIRHVVYLQDNPRNAQLAIVTAELRLAMQRGRESEIYPPGRAQGSTRHTREEEVRVVADNGLRGPFALSDATIDREVTERSAGVYVLDEWETSNAFQATYVGRSDTDVNNQLHVYVGSYGRFKFEYYSSPKAAFDKECALYHDFEPPDNIYHPTRPSASAWTCPRCALFR